MGFPLAAIALAAFLGAMDIESGRADEAPTAAEIDAALATARRVLPSGAAGLAIPVHGIQASQIIDTFSHARGGGRRVHNALDIMAPRGTPVVAAADGVVERLHVSRAGGITAYVRSADGRWMYYYAHLDSYAPGLAAGQRLRQGDPIGRVGSTGNASSAWPHLHFAMYRMDANDRWYQGRAVNPYPLLAGRSARR